MRIKAEHLTFGFPKQGTLLNDVSFNIEQGRIVAVLGPNGAGKTTLIRCLLGFLEPRSGTITMDDRPLRSYPARELSRRTAYVPQAKSTAFAYTVEETVLLGRSPYLSLFEAPSAEDRAIAAKAMRDCGVEHLAGQRTDEISGGELQLVLIARALTQQPEMLILDEPETGLDFRNQLLVLTLLETLSKEKGLTILFNTHYPDHALRIADETLILNSDGTGLFGPVQAVVRGEILQEVFGVNIHTMTETIGGKIYSAMIPLPQEDTQ